MTFDEVTTPSEENDVADAPVVDAPVVDAPEVGVDEGQDEADSEGPVDEPEAA